MENFYIDAFNIQNGYTKMHIVKAESREAAIEIIESPMYDSETLWEVSHYSRDGWLDYL
jgi:uncharacterized protein YpmB